MKSLITFIFVVVTALLVMSCEDSTNQTIEITDFTSRSASVSNTSSSKSPMMKVSFVDDKCMTVLSASKVSEIIMETVDGQVTLSSIGKRSGVFCAPNDAKVISVTVNSSSSKGEQFSQKFDAIAAK